MGMGLNQSNYYSDLYTTQTPSGNTVKNFQVSEDQDQDFRVPESEVDAAINGEIPEGGYEYQDSYIPLENTEADSFSGAPGIEETLAELEGLQTQIEGDPRLATSRKQDLLRPIATARVRLLQAKNAGPDSQRRTVTEVGAKLVELQADLEIQPELQSLDERCKALEEEIQATVFPEDAQSTKEGFLRDLGKARGEMDLNPTSEKLASLQETLSGIENDFEGKKSELDAQKEETLSKFDEKKNGLLEKIQGSSSLKDSEKEAFQSEIETKSSTLRKSLENGEIKLDAAVKEIDDVDYRAGGEDREARLIQDFDAFSSKVPSKGYCWEFTKEAAGKILQGLSGKNDADWDPARRMFDSLATNEDHDKYETAAGNNVVMQLLGTIFYKMADQDDKKFKEYLDLIPRDVRQKMKKAVLANEGERNNADGYNSDADKEGSAIFGIPTDCAQALEASLRWSQDSEKSRTRLTDTSNNSSEQE